MPIDWLSSLLFALAISFVLLLAMALAKAIMLLIDSILDRIKSKRTITNTKQIINEILDMRGGRFMYDFSYSAGVISVNIIDTDTLSSETVQDTESGIISKIHDATERLMEANNA